MMFKRLLVGGLTLTSVGVSQAAAQVYVATPAGLGTPGLTLLQDLNGDGDANDPGERITVRDAAGAGLSTPQGFVDVAVGPSGQIYAVEPEGKRILAFTDLDSDGDTQSAGEARAFFTSVAVTGGRFTALAADAVWNEADKLQADGVFALDPVAQHLNRYVDLNGDGIIHPEAADEVESYHTLMSGQPFTAVKMTAANFGMLFGTLINHEAVARIWSANGDAAIEPPSDEPPDNCTVNDASGAKEYLTLREDRTSLYGETGITRLSDDTLLVAVPGVGGQDVGRILWLRDKDGDEDTASSNEIGIWAQLSCPSVPGLLMVNPSDIVAIEGDTVVAADYNEPILLWFKDKNSDGDALDAGECGLYASGLVNSWGLATRPKLPPEVALSLSGAAVRLEEKGPKVSVPLGSSSAVTLTVTDIDTGLPVSGVPVRCDVLEGCLSCTRRTQKSDAAGHITFTVTHGSPTPTTASGALMLTAGGGQQLFFEATWPLLKLTDDAGAYITHLDYGDVQLGEVSSQQVWVYNVGSQTLSGEATVDNGQFLIAGGSYEVSDPSAPWIVEVSLAPDTEGVAGGIVTLTGGGGAELYVEGNGVAATGGCSGKAGLPALLILPLLPLSRRRRSRAQRSSGV